MCSIGRRSRASSSSRGATPSFWRSSSARRPRARRATFGGRCSPCCRLASRASRGWREGCCARAPDYSDTLCAAQSRDPSLRPDRRPLQPGGTLASTLCRHATCCRRLDIEWTDMTTYFDLARVDAENRVHHIRSRLQLSMSAENAQRLLGILGESGTSTFLPPQHMRELLDRAVTEQSARAASIDDRRARYELPRLNQLQCLFHAAAIRGYGVMVWRDE